MPPEIPTSEPTELTAGDTWRWDRVFAEFPPADGWTLTYVIDGTALTGALFRQTLNSTPAGDHFEVRVAAADTESIPPGSYRLIAYATKAPDRFQALRSVSAHLYVHPNLEAAGDFRSFAERMVADLEAELAARKGKGLTSWTQGQRSESQMSDADIERRLGYWRAQVRRERTGELTRDVGVRFVAP